MRLDLIIATWVLAITFVTIVVVAVVAITMRFNGWADRREARRRNRR